MKIYYENSIREIYDMSDFPVAIEDITNLYEKSWDYEATKQQNKNSSKLERFYRTEKKIKLTLSIFADTKEEYQECMERFESITEYDVLNKTSGRLWVGEFYLNCFITVSEPKEYEELYYAIENDITVVSFYPFWIKEKEYIYKASEIVSSHNKQYAYRYPYRYANGLTNTSILNEHFAECNFRLIIYGPAINPVMAIGGHEYRVDIVLEEKEYLEINSEEETAKRIMATGKIINAFHNRDFNKSVFKKIQSGMNEIVWSGKFDFDIILCLERSVPKW